MEFSVDNASGVIALAEELNKVLADQFTGEEIISDERTTKVTTGEVNEEDMTRTDTHETIVKQQIKATTTQINAKSKTTTKKVGEYMTSIAWQPYIPGTVIYFVATGLRPGLRHYVYFDDMDINSHVAPATLYNAIDSKNAIQSLTTTRAPSIILFS